MRVIRSRRGVAVGAAVLVLVLVNAAVIMSVAGSVDDAGLAASRASTIRAFFASESGVHLVVGELSAGRDVPTGVLSLPGGAEVEISASDTAAPMDVEIRGSYLDAVRVIAARIE
ncbi:MAG: hypothetical protein R3B46_11700 [Phycisphaerales bacterium]